MEIITTRLSKFRSYSYTYFIPIIIIIGKVYTGGFDGLQEGFKIRAVVDWCALMRTVRNLRVAFSTRVARTVGSAAIKATEASALPNGTFTGSVGGPIVNTIICPV